MLRNAVRIKRMSMSGVDISKLHFKSPWMPMWWSAALPGLGHFCQGHYFKGLILMFWEIIINFQASLNLAIMYTFTGQFTRAREVVEPSWALLYGVVFSFAIFDAYRIAVEQNMLARLEKEQPRRSYRFTKMNSFSFNYLSRCNPWVALGWSTLFAGFGHLYTNKAVKAFILVIWAALIIHFSHINHGIIATFTGDFTMAKETVNYQWLLFFPSLYTFAMWDAYNDAVELNKLFAEAQKEYLKQKFS